jgi:hypothetical protein
MQIYSPIILLYVLLSYTPSFSQSSLVRTHPAATSGPDHTSLSSDRIAQSLLLSKDRTPKRQYTIPVLITIAGAVTYIAGEALQQRQYRKGGDIKTSTEIKLVGAIITGGGTFMTFCSVLAYPPPKHKRKSKDLSLALGL